VVKISVQMVAYNYSRWRFTNITSFFSFFGNFKPMAGPPNIVQIILFYANLKAQISCFIMAREQINQMIKSEVLEQFILVIQENLHKMVILSHQVATKIFFVRRFFVQFSSRNNIKDIKKIFGGFKI